MHRVAWPTLLRKRSNADKKCAVFQEWPFRKYVETEQYELLPVRVMEVR